MLAAGHIARLLQEGGEGGSEEGDERQPLLIRIDADDAGSVGSQDTECEEGDVEGGCCGRGRCGRWVVLIDEGAVSTQDTEYEQVMWKVVGVEK